MNNQTQHTKVLNRNRKYMYKAIIVLTRGFVIIIRVLIIRNIQMGVPLRVNQLVTFNSSTNPLVCTSEFGTWVWIWKGPSTFATNMDSMALEPCKINKVEPPLKNNKKKKKKLFPPKKTHKRLSIQNEVLEENQERNYPRFIYHIHKHIRREK